MRSESKIDTHAHFIPPFYRKACEDNGHGKPDGMPEVPPWSEEAHLALMKDNSITKSILSISSPGVYLNPADPAFCRSLTRQCNEFASELAARRPNQFGFWAVLPLPDVAGALEEISFAADTLHADGFALETNHQGKYLGDPAFDEVFAELNRRKATVFIHPTSPCMLHSTSGSHAPVTFLPQYPNPMFEFMFDSVRTMINLFLSGTITRCPDITFIMPHAGAVLPPVVERFCGFAGLLGTETVVTSQVVKDTFKRQFYFDLAGLPFPDQIFGLLRFVGSEKLLYGSDFPFTRANGVASLAEKMKVGLEAIFPDERVRADIYTENAKRLLGFTR